MPYIHSESNIKFDINSISSVWFRRGSLNISKKIDNALSNFLNEESYHIKNYIYYLLSSKKRIGEINSSIINKLIVNDIARSVGLSMPKTFLLTSQEELKKIFKKHELITKVIAGNGFLRIDNERFGIMYTSLVNRLDKFSYEFAPSYFQEKIEKRYELRIFYLLGNFYTMAIFSQNDKQTQIDFRKYNKENPNRNVPFKLPRQIQQRLKKLMDELKLTTGSIDMIVDKEMNYYFLEVNPEGQFGMVSFPCNYNLEKEIANSLK